MFNQFDPDREYNFRCAKAAIFDFRMKPSCRSNWTVFSTKDPVTNSELALSVSYFFQIQFNVLPLADKH